MSASDPRLERLIERLVQPESGVHAVLLYGSGQSPIRYWMDHLVAMWACKNPGPSGPCGECGPCRSENGGVDVQIIEPVSNPPIINLEMITEVDRPGKWEGVPVRRFVRTPPMMSPRKVVAITDFERANHRAANALLKTLEEPSPYARLILTTTRLSRVMRTIRSRCLCVGVPESREADLIWSKKPTNEETEQSLAELRSILELAVDSPNGAALRTGDQLRKWAAQWQKTNDISDRAALLDLLQFTADWLSHTHPERYNLRSAIQESHRLMISAHPTLLLDVLSLELTGSSRS
ncbi:MAG TPA: hypothetical protein PLB31_00095 [Fimbriimonadaceae bacterium]|nr:hypothetical protein [Armatimonadota bacterium]HCM73701.1 hypothetical protein [Armatimonadota bacterium]HRI72849.1 hypothetical protein [Fimbriimonadaceae bacterium]